MTFYTTNDQLDKSKYDCYNNSDCTKSITYDDWHCSGCRWKGMGTAERKWSAEVMQRYNETKTNLFFEIAATGKLK